MTNVNPAKPTPDDEGDPQGSPPAPKSGNEGDPGSASQAFHDYPTVRPGSAWLLMLALAALLYLWGAWRAQSWLPTPASRLLAVFLPTVLGLMLRPIPGGALVLMAITLCAMVGALTLEKALTGYADPSVWLVLAAYFLSRAFLKTGLARRIALTFVRALGGNTLGLSYALVASDAVLAAMIPSNAARVGGVLLPITRSLAQLYQSYPGATARRLGLFLMIVLYQADVVACAMFLTGQASNPLAADMARAKTSDLPDGSLPVDLSYRNWLLYALAPGVVSLLVVPALVYRWQRPEITHTPEAVDMARRELARMGRLSRGETFLTLVFLGVCGFWIAGIGSTTLVALAGVAVLLLSGVLTWDDAINERGAWDVFIWYGGLVLLGKQLNESGLTTEFADAVVGGLPAMHWMGLFLITLVIYFFAHYAFASITAHITAMYGPFVAVLLAAGAPPGVVAISFAFFTNFAAGLTHYGTTPGPIIFSVGYVSHPTWWRIGFWLALVNLTIWLTIGMAWWKWFNLW